MVFPSDKALQEAYAKYLQGKGHSVVVNIPIGQQGSVVDILTETEVIKCTCQLTSASAVAVKSYFDFYGRFYAKWQKVVVVQEIIDPASLPLLTNAGIKLVTVPKSLEKQQAPPKITLPAQAPSYPSSKPLGRQIEEGKGGLEGLLAIGLVILLGLIGMLAANSRSSTNSPVSIGGSGHHSVSEGPDDDKIPFPRFSTGFSAFNLL